MSNGTENGTDNAPVESTSAFVGRRLRRFVMAAAVINLLLCLAFLVAVTRANSMQICAVVGINIQSYIEPLSREIVLGNREHLATILDALKSSNLLKDVSLSEVNTIPDASQSEQCQLNGANIEFMMPVTFGQRQVGMLKGSVVWLPVAQILTFLGVAALCLMIFMWISTRSLLDDLHKVLITPIWKLARGEVLSNRVFTSDVLKIKRDLEASRENAKYAAVAQLTQMLAHDVRKPFSMIRIVLQNIATAQTLSEIKSIIHSSSREINHALTSVSEMLTDIMEMGQDTTRARELISPKSLIHISLHEICRLFPDSRITFSTSFEHRYLLEINPGKIQRVFSNIVENAVQAMEGQGHIWFQTSATDKSGFVELIIGNSNSYVEPADAQRIFEAFFTKDKKGGTGLGLAIAKKIITAHGGQIGCRIVEKGVEFWFTLLASDQIDTVNLILPESTMEIQMSQPSTNAANVSEFSEDVLSETYETEIVRKLNGRRVKVLVLDDEELYRNALIRLLQKLNQISPFIDVLVAASGNEALAHSVSKPDIGLFDYDLGAASPNGIETLKMMRQRVPGMCICIHSNHIGGTQYKEAVDAGAQYFLPKPISKVHLLRIINNSLNVTQLHMTQTGAPEYPYSAVLSPLPFPVTRPDTVVAIVDDCEFNCRAWKQMNTGRPLVTFKSPEMFWQHTEQHPDFINSLTLIITDHFFGSESAITGIEFAKILMENRVGKPVFLSSVGDFSNQLPIPGIAGILPGKVMEWNELLAFCAARSVTVTDAYALTGEKAGEKIAENKADNFQVSLKIKFFASAVEIVNEIEMAMQQKNLQQVSELAHKLQGAASIAGVSPIVDACRKWYYHQLSGKEFMILLHDAVIAMEQELRSSEFNLAG